MSVQTGAYTVADLLANENQTVAEFGEDRVAEVLLRDLAILNAQIDEQMSWLARPVTALNMRIGRYGVSNRSTFVELDELGNPPAQKIKGGYNMGYPLKKYGGATGWSRDYLAQATVQDFTKGVVERQVGYKTALQRELKVAIYTSTNYTFKDRLITNSIDLPVKAFLNADGQEIMDGPNGEQFDGSTLTHYRANNGWDNTFLKDSVDDLTIHGFTAKPVIVINRNNKSDMEGLADFKPLADDRIVHIATDRTVQYLDRGNIGNRLIGYFHDAEVWVKPWAISDYPFITDVGQPEDKKPLRYRQHHVASMRGLRIASEIDDYPLMAAIMDAYFGFGVQERRNGVVVYFGGGTYVVPTIN